MVAQAASEFGLHSRNVANSTEVLAGNSSEFLADKNKPVQAEEKIQLKRELGLFSAVNLIVGVMIGSGIFVSPSLALEQSGSVGLCLIIWALGGAISLVGALCFAELGLLVPRSGAEYVFFQEAFNGLHKFWGPLPSFLCSWMYVVVLRPAEVAVIMMSFSRYVCQPFLIYTGDIDPDSLEMAKKLIAMAAVALLTYINFASVKLYVRMQNVFTMSKLLACLIIIVAGIYYLCIGRTENISGGFEGSNVQPKNIALAIYYCLWPYDGWSTVTVVTEEIKRPEVNILRSIIIAVPLVTVVYFLMNVSYMTVLTIPEMTAATAVAVTFADKVLGVMKFVIPLGVALSTFGCALSIQFSVTRLCFVAGKEGHMMEAFSYIHMRRLTPAPAVVLQGVLTFFFILAGDIATLIDFLSFLFWIFYLTAMVALLVMRYTKKDAERSYKVPIVFPVFIIFVSVFLCVVPIVTDPTPKYFIALLLIAVGVAMYIPLIFYRLRPRFMDTLTHAIQKLMEVVPTHQQPD